MPKPITWKATRYAKAAKKAITGFITRIGASTDPTRPPSGGFFVSGAT